MKRTYYHLLTYIILHKLHAFSLALLQCVIPTKGDSSEFLTKWEVFNVFLDPSELLREEKGVDRGNTIGSSLEIEVSVVSFKG